MDREERLARAFRQLQDPEITVRDRVNILNEARTETWIFSDGRREEFNPSPLQYMEVVDRDGRVEQYIVGDLNYAREKDPFFNPSLRRKQSEERTIFSRVKQLLPKSFR